MTRKLPGALAFLASVALLRLVAQAGAVEPPGRPGPSVLAVTRPEQGWQGGAHYRLIARPLVDAGFDIDVCFEDDMPARLATGRYSVVVTTGFRETVYADDPRRAEAELGPLRKSLGDFTSRGGGVLVLGCADPGAIPATNALIEPWGARLLYEKTTGAGAEKDLFVKWAFTRRVSGPAAPGIGGIWYPTGRDESGRWWWPIEVGEPWSVVLRGEPGTAPKPVSWSRDLDRIRRRKPADPAEGVPLAAVREAGAGRVAVVGLPHTYSFEAPFRFRGADAFLTEGFAGVPSDGRLLLFNLLRWLAEPATRHGLGGAKTPPRVLEPYTYREKGTPPPPRWTLEFEDPPRLFRGLVGARTKHSTGRSTVAEYAAAARAAGLDFLVFLDEHARMTAEKTLRLIDECREASDDSFRAIPGFTIADEYKNSWFYLGSKAVRPDPIYLSADGSVLAGNGGRGDARARTLGLSLLNLFLNQYQAQARAGTWNHARGSMPVWDARDCSAIAVATRDEDGKTTDEVIDDYRLTQGNGPRLEPLALELMRSASQVPERVREGWLVYLRGSDLAKSAALLERHEGACVQAISAGPVVEDWQLQGGTYPGLIGDDERPDLYRMRLRLSVRSAAGLEEVAIHDGPRLIRRFAPGGATEFSRELELFNHVQQSLVLTATDRRGRKAVSRNLITQCGDFVEFLCSDRNNQIFNGYAIRPDGSVFYEAPPTGNGVTPDKGPANWLISPCYPYVYDFRSHHCPWDGGSTCPGYAMFLMPRIRVADGLPPEKPLHNSARRLLHSRDVMIGRAVIDGGYPDAVRDRVGMVWQSVFPVERTRYLAGSMTLSYWRTRPDGITFTLFDETIRFRERARLEGDRPITVGQLSTGGEDAEYEVRDEQGRLHAGKCIAIEGTLRGRLGEGGYVSLRNAESNSSFFSLAGGLGYVLHRGGCQLILEFPEGSRDIPAGAEFRVKVLGVGTPQKPFPDAPRVADEAFGVRDGRPGYEVSLSEGRVLSRRFLLAMDGAADAPAAGRGVVGRIPKHPLPAALPVTVSGLNPNWPAVVLDRTRGRWRPVGVHEDSAHLRLDPSSSDLDFMIGHPAACDRPELVMALVPIGPRRWSLEVHNPTAEAQRTTIRLHRGFTPLAGAPEELPAEVPAGQSRFLEFSVPAAASSPLRTARGSSGGPGRFASLSPPCAEANCKSP
ncbi:MAG: hypothetical protein U0790_14750 [Isosphaeraceae bacterium]